jgi:hypothetical protein
MTDSRTLAQAACELGISRSQLMRDIRAGAPVARLGSRGRGRQTLLDPEAITAWRRSRSAPQPDDRLALLAAEIPSLLAAAVHSAFLQIEGPHKRASAGTLAAAWYLATVALLDRLRADVPGIPEVSTVPEAIESLRKITAK